LWGNVKGFADVANDLLKCKIELLMKRDRLIGVLHNYKEGLLSFEDLMTAVDEYTEASNGAKPVLADSAIRDALSILLRVGASMVTTGISGDISDWELPKTTPIKTKRKIVQEVDKWNDVNRRRAIELKNAYDVLSRHFR
jgi:hypothetical protein